MRDGVVEEKQPLAWGLQPSLLEAGSAQGRLCSWPALLEASLGSFWAWPLAQRSHFTPPTQGLRPHWGEHQLDPRQT